MLFAAWSICLLLSPQQPAPAPAPAPAAVPTVAPPPITVSGSVLDAQLRPIAGIAVAVAEPQQDLAAGLAQPLARTDTHGAFRVSVPVPTTGSRWLVVGGNGLTTVMAELQVRSKDVELGPIALAAGIAGAGRVRDAAGAPIEGVWIEVQDLLELQPYIANRAGARWSCRTWARSDARGVFKLPGMVPSGGRLRARADGCYDELLFGVGVGEPLDVVMTKSVPVRGCVVDAAGAPIPKATVWVGTQNEQRIESAVDGTFEVSPRKRGAQRVYTSMQIAGRWQSNAVTAQPGGEPLELRLTADAAVDARVVRVVARDAAGKPVPAFNAYASWNPQHQMQYRPDALLLARWSRDQRDWTAAAQDGTAALTGPSPEGETLIVFVRADGHGLGRIEADEKALGGEPLVVTLQPEAILRGRVVDAQSGAPIAGARVLTTQHLADDERGHYGMGFRSVADFAATLLGATTDADGRYELRSVPAGKSDLFVHCKDRIELPPVPFEIAAGEVRGDVDLRIPANVTLQGRFDGALPAAAQVRVHWHRPNMSSSGWAGEYGGAVPFAKDGTFTIEGLHPKQYEVQLLCAPPPRGGQWLKLPAGIWDGANVPKERTVLPSPGPVRVTGKVGGPVPWQRLAVAVLCRLEREGSTYRGDFGIDGPTAALRPGPHIPADCTEAQGARAAVRPHHRHCARVAGARSHRCGPGPGDAGRRRGRATRADRGERRAADRQHGAHRARARPRALAGRRRLAAAGRVRRRSQTLRHGW